MSREVRRVPAGWQHPKYWTCGLNGLEERYKPQFPGESYKPRVEEWDEECAKWKASHPYQNDEDEDERPQFYEQWAGQRPHRDDYMPDWPFEDRTHLMMYETTSEGTPISPAFATPEELARWLVDNEASANGRDTGSYEGWLRVARGGWAPSMVASADGVVSGVDFVGSEAAGKA